MKTIYNICATRLNVRGDQLTKAQREKICHLHKHISLYEDN
jgi:hypothetical protein